MCMRTMSMIRMNKPNWLTTYRNIFPGSIPNVIEAEEDKEVLKSASAKGKPAWLTTFEAIGGSI